MLYIVWRFVTIPDLFVVLINNWQLMFPRLRQKWPDTAEESQKPTSCSSRWLLCSLSVVLQPVSIVIRACQWSRHDDVIKWKHFPRNWPFVRGIHRSPMNSQHKGQWREALMFSLICARITGWVNNGEAGDLLRYRAHSDVIVIEAKWPPLFRRHVETHFL